MTHQIIIEVDATGKAHVAVDGMPGPGCEDALAFLQDMPVEILEEGHTEQWHDKPERESGQRVRREVRA